MKLLHHGMTTRCVPRVLLVRDRWWNVALAGLIHDRRTQIDEVGASMDDKNKVSFSEIFMLHGFFRHVANSWVFSY
jgi:hypothetical protein